MLHTCVCVCWCEMHSILYGPTVCEQLADGIRVAASATITITTAVAITAITSTVMVTTFVPLCFMLTILSFIPYSFYRHATWAVEMESFHSFIHENIKSQKLVFIIFLFFFFVAFLSHVLLLGYVHNVQCGIICDKGVYNEKTRAAIPCHYHSYQIKMGAKETEYKWMRGHTHTYRKHTNLNTKYTINDSFNSIAWVNFQISFNIALKLCTSYSTGFNSGFALLCLLRFTFLHFVWHSDVYSLVYPSRSDTRPPRSSSYFSLSLTILCMHVYTKICTMHFNKCILSIHVNAVFAYPFCLGCVWAEGDE